MKGQRSVDCVFIVVCLCISSGLLGGHSMAVMLKEGGQHMQWYQDELLHMAKDLGLRLLPAFNTSSGLPYPRVRHTHWYCLIGAVGLYYQIYAIYTASTVYVHYFISTCCCKVFSGVSLLKKVETHYSPQYSVLSKLLLNIPCHTCPIKKTFWSL